MHSILKNNVLSKIARNQAAAVAVKDVKFRKMLTKTNSKLKKDQILAFTLQASKKNCPFAGACAKYCYAKKGFYTWKNVRTPHIQNRNDFDFNPGAFVTAVNLQLMTESWEFVRMHSGGDFFSVAYLNAWILIAEANPSKIFYAYSKSLPFFEAIESLPENFILIQSEGTLNDAALIDYSKPYARIFSDVDSFNAAIESGKFIDSSDSDLNAVKAAISGLNIALLDHDFKRSCRRPDGFPSLPDTKSRNRIAIRTKSQGLQRCF